MQRTGHRRLNGEIKYLRLVSESNLAESMKQSLGDKFADEIAAAWVHYKELADMIVF